MSDKEFLNDLIENEDYSDLREISEEKYDQF